MKITLLTTQSKKEPWVEAAKELYLKKIKAFVSFQIEDLKASRFDRESSNVTVQLMDDAILKRIASSDLVVLFDESGKSLGSSIEFSKKISSILESGKSQVYFVIGGAFGVGAKLKARANMTLSLGSFTMSHHVAVVVVLEQVYRALTIAKGLPYHNEGSSESRPK